MIRRRGAARGALVAVGVLLGGAPPAVAQVAPLGALAEALPAPYRDPERSVRVLRPLRDRHPESAALHLAAAREWTALGIVAPDAERRLASFREAEAAARAALAVDSASAEPHYWLAVALGLIADHSGGLDKITAARAAHTHVVAALALDPDHGGSHHILGRMHAGVLRLGRLNRLIARGLGLGPLLSQASWKSAEEHLRKALATDPEPLVHTLELARLLARGGGEAEARQLVDGILATAPRHALDAHYQALARDLRIDLTAR